MKLNSRVKDIEESITLKMNENIERLSFEGKHIYNLTAGQLPFKPPAELTQSLLKQINFLKSYQYSPVAGFSELREIFFNNHLEKRDIPFTFSAEDNPFDIIISNGSKSTLFNALGALLNVDDEVIILAPYWITYPEIIKLWGGKPIVVKSHAYDAYSADLEEIKEAITKKTRAIIINSPNNPAGIHYSEKWMKEFSHFLKDYPELVVISDELYAEVSYFDPKPRYFYEYDKTLLERTLIVSGISKSFASTGLRIGYAIGPKALIEVMVKIQGQSSSGANSLVQKALIQFDFKSLDHFLDDIKLKLRESAEILREEFRNASLPQAWYQTTSAFYFLVDFSRTPYFEAHYEDRRDEDFAAEICHEILEKTGVALVPGSLFGQKNTARVSLVLEKAPFIEAIQKLVRFLTNKS